MQKIAMSVRVPEFAYLQLQAIAKFKGSSPSRISTDIIAVHVYAMYQGLPAEFKLQNTLNKPEEFIGVERQSTELSTENPWQNINTGI